MEECVKCRKCLCLTPLLLKSEITHRLNRIFLFFYRTTSPAIVLSKVLRTWKRQKQFNLLSTIATHDEHEQITDHDQDKFTNEFLTNRIPASQFQKFILSAGASLASLIDPHR